MKLVFKTLSQKVLMLFLTGLVIFSGVKITTGQSAHAYIKHHAPMAVQMMKKTGIPASVILGVGMVESANGTSKNCKLLNNHFGIVGPNGLRGRYRSRYKGYQSEQESFVHFIQLLTSKGWYQNMMWNFDTHTWLTKINANNAYSENGDKWVKRIESVINLNGLKRFDKR